MKGIPGLILAVVLGIAGALFNWAYLASRSSQEETVAFVGIKEGTTVNRGEALREGDIEAVRIPKRWVGNLTDFAVLDEAKGGVVGRPVWRTMTGPRLLLGEDLVTPPEELRLDDSDVMWIPVDTRAFVPSLVMPGDRVSFLVPRSKIPTPGMPGNAAAASGLDKPIGPFTILALGNRLGSPAVMRAAKAPQLQENVLAIRVSDNIAGERERAEKLWKLLQSTNFRQVGVVLHNRKN